MVEVRHHIYKSKEAIAEQNLHVKEGYVSKRALGAYIAAHCRPDLSFGFARASQYIDPKPDSC